MKRLPFLIRTSLVALGLSSLVLTGCDPETLDELEQLISERQDQLGWYGEQETQRLDSIENGISLGSSTDLPSKVDLSDKFPPIGDQGQYGTCVSWAVGYNVKTVIEGIDKGYTKSDLSQSSKQFSPKDLFWSIPNDQKGDDCNGTGFEAAFDIIQSRGLAKLSTVPYTNLGNCSKATTGGESEAAGYKIENYREVSLTVAELKKYLAQGRPIAFGAKLGDEFMSAKGSAVLSYQTYGYTGQHAYHAMSLCGYDDSKGSNGAFRVVNSWGTGWGDGGYIWVDQKYFVTQNFAFCAFVATNKGSNPDTDGDNVVDDEVVSDGTDLLAWELQDFQHTDNNTLHRKIKYNVFNSGSTQIDAAKDWNIVYLCYNAYDANEYEILLYDYYTNDYGSLGQDGDLSQQSGAELYGSSGNWWNNVNVPAGQSVAQALYGGQDARFNWDYYMKNTLNGDYYFVLWADAFEVVDETDEQNNYYYFTGPNDAPLKVTNGVIDGQLTSKKGATTPKQGDDTPSGSPTKNKARLNAYTPDEITTFLKQEKANGNLQKKLKAFNQQRAASKSGK